MTPYPKRLIEVDLPIARISAHARREKSIRHGHISTLHIWWARRPLAACRAVILASLWPDPVDLAYGEFADPALPTVTPARFLDEARAHIRRWADNVVLYAHQEKVSPETAARLTAIAKTPSLLDGKAGTVHLRQSLLDFIADFANWDNSTDAEYLATARALTQAAHECLGGEPGTRPMVIDPFAGGGSIPLEALRVGADAFASDLNPIPVLLNKVVLEYIPKYGQRLADEVRRWGQWIKEEAEKELAQFYPKDAAIPPKRGDKDDPGTPEATPIAYLWARTILSEAPGQGDIPVEVPLMRSLWLAKKAGRRRAFRWVRDDKGKVKTQTVEVAYVEDGQRILKRVKRPLLEIFEPAKESDVEGGTVARGSATCPVTGFTTKVDRVRAQLKSRRGGAADARLFCVVTTREDEQGRFYRLPTKADQEAFDDAAVELERREKEDGTQRSQKGRKDGEGIAAGQGSRRSLVPDEPLDVRGIRAMWVMLYGLERWGDLFSPRQALALTTLAQLVREAGERLKRGETVPNGAEKGGITGTKTTSAGTKGISVGTEMISAGTKGTFAGTKMTSAGTETLSAGTKKGSAGTGEASAARRTGIPPASGRGSGVFSGLSSDSEDDRADNQFGVADAGLSDAVVTVLSLALSRVTDISNTLCRWKPSMDQAIALFGRQAIGLMWDFAETSPVSDGAAGDFAVTVGNMLRVLETVRKHGNVQGHVERASATNHPLPDDAAAALITDPPYYDAVPYACLSDFFYVWMRRTLADVHPSLFREGGVPKDAEIVVDRPHQLSKSTKDIAFYERELTKAFAEGRRVLAPSGVGTIVFASKTTASWEAILKAVIDAGFIITGSWPIDTEMETRVAAQGQARLGSSVHIVVRPRENPDGSVATGDVGEWREVLAELPKKMEDWMPRLAEEGVVGADAIFACIGPALEIFSRYTRVERASGEQVTLKEYLVEVWAAVSKEALSLIMKDADTSGLEPDARLTAVWLWTVGGGKKATTEGTEGTEEGGDEEEDDEEGAGKKGAVKGFVLEADAAFKIAQGLGVHLDKSESIVEIKGETARLRAVAERTTHLFGKEAQGPAAAMPKGRRKKAEASLFQTQEQVIAEIVQAEAASVGKLAAERPGATVLDRLHQAMLLFGAGRGEALRRFLVDDGIGKDARFWKLAQSLSALYPSGADEKRWVDGVLARKKGLGF